MLIKHVWIQSQISSLMFPEMISCSIAGVSLSLAALFLSLFPLSVYVLFDIFLLFRIQTPPQSQPPGVIFPISSLSFSPSLSLLWWSFYWISLRSSPLSLMCSIKDASLIHTHAR